MNLRERILSAALAVFVCATGIAIVDSKHRSRMLFKQGRELQVLIDDSRVQWGRLQIEESTLARYGRIEDIASNKLRMISPLNKDVRVVFR